MNAKPWPSLRRPLVLISILVLGLAIGICATKAGRSQIKALDLKFLDGVLVDTYAEWLGYESWKDAPALPRGLDYGWASADESGAVRLAHAMGGWGRAGEENELQTLRQAISNGFRIIEADFSMGSDGRLYCFHGPGLPPRSVTERPKPCDIDAVLHEMSISPFVLVLDLKTDFDEAAAVVRQRVHDPELARRIVFQLYTPRDIQSFVQWKHEGWAGPIVTLYRTNRTRYHMIPHLQRIGAGVVTVPLERIQEFKGARELDTKWLTHPLKNCHELRAAVSEGFDGGYLSALTPCTGEWQTKLLPGGSHPQLNPRNQPGWEI